MKRGNFSKAPLKAAAVLVVLLCLSSCLGVSADIALNADGSGTLALEYRISRTLKTLGEQDGNERWYPLPVGKADFERTLRRLPGLTLLSFAAKDDGKDLTVTVKLGFTTMEALVAFLDAYGENAVYTKTGGAGRLLLTLYGGGAEANKELEAFFAEISSGYAVKISLSPPVEGTLALLDRSGKPASPPPGGEIQGGGKKLSFALPLAGIFTAREGLSLDFRW
jgi:hypothetical protein